MALSFLSLEYISLATGAIFLLSVLDGVARQGIFLSINLFFLWGLLLGPWGTLSTLAFCGLGYLCAKAVLQWPHRYMLPGCLAGMVLLFVYMQKYDFLHWVLSENLLTQSLRTVGLSFLFFKIIHVLIEARSRTLGDLYFLTYLNYCLNFTTFMMGPIQRYQDYFTQWYRQKVAIQPDFESYLDSALRVLVGLVKAYVIATWFEAKALRPDTDLFTLSLVGLLVQVYAFYFYLYFNFSGYCDVVIGIGSLFGVRPPENFNFPFLARNVSDFWLRQHRSLTLWLTDFIFSPLYKKTMEHAFWGRRPLFSANVALICTMLVSGLWHGTTVNFFLFGLAHGIFLVIYRTWDVLLIKWIGKRKVRALRERWIVQLAGIFLTFNATAFAFIFFRLNTLPIGNSLRQLFQ